MIQTQHKFVIEMLPHEGGASLGQFPVEPDWEPAIEHLLVQGMRRCKRAGSGKIMLEPVWADEGEPRVAGVRLRDGDLESAVKVTYFKPLAVEISTQLVETKVLKSGELFRFRLYAYRETSEAREPELRFTVRDATPPLPFVDSSLDELRSASVPSDDAETDEMPVFIPQGVLDECESLTMAAGANETGGIFIGRMHRDLSIPDVAVVVTAQIPAHFTESKTTSLTFTEDTWTAVRAAIDLRRSGELQLGWWHSHPSFAFCNEACPPERRRVCDLQKPFLSSADVHFHRAVFPRGNHVALLANNSDAGFGFALFGWSGGTVQHRGYRILGGTLREAPAAPAISNETSTGELNHVTSCKK